MKLFFTLVTLVFTVATNAAGYIDSVPPVKPSPENIVDKQKAEAKPVTIRIRCGRTNYAEPLLIINGVVCEFKQLQVLNPNDIASIDILKEAAATALFGCRAATGVIIITTKTALNRKFIIKDFLTGEKIPAATICFTSGKDTIKALADDNGILVTNKLKPAMEYNMTVSSAGYKTISATVAYKEHEIRLQRDVKECGNVIVSCTECVRTIRCGATATVTREKGISSINESLRGAVYPNPVLRNNAFNIDFKNERDASVQLAIVSLSGSIVFQQSQKISKGLNHLSVAANAKWAAGIYNIQLRNESGTSIREEKLVVQ